MIERQLCEWEGTWEEIAAHAEELKGQRLRLIVLSMESNGQEGKTLSPAERFAAAMREAEELERDMPFTSGDDTQALLREARAGAMYGYESTE